MAKFNPHTGLLSGKLGNLIYSSWRGIPYTRSRPKPNYKATPAQLAQRQKFALATRFCSTVAPLLNQAFLTADAHKTGRTSAISYICKYAITGTAPLLELDYPRLLISHGELPGTPAASASLNADGQVQFCWTNIGDNGLAANSDKVLLVLYCPALQLSSYNTAAADRRAEEATLDASAFSGYTVHCWLGFRSEDGKQAANSVYTGSILIA